MIGSVTNQKIKEACKLRHSKERIKQKRFIFEGEREIFRALESEIELVELFVCPGFASRASQKIIAAAKVKDIDIQQVNTKVYEKLAYGNRRDGLVAVAVTPERTLADINLSRNPLLVIIERVEKPGNVGAILRTADACALDGVIICDPAGDIYNHHVVRASTGVLFANPVVKASSSDVLPWLRSNKIALICADPGGGRQYTSIDFKKASAIVLGSEDKGVSDFWKDNADILASIPMKGKADSLNISITAALFMFEAMRQRS
jgi:RNA methyltransferase, TrmH family